MRSRTGSAAGTATTSVVITAPTLNRSRGSTVYSWVMRYPRRATFSVRIECCSTRTLSPYETTEAINRAGRALRSWVSSRAKITLVKGRRIVPASAAAMLTRGHKVRSPPGTALASSAPRAQPIIKSGASTPPDVPEPSAIAQISPLTTISPSSARATYAPRSRSAIRPYPTPSALGSTSPPRPTTSPPSTGHHIQWSGRRWKASSGAVDGQRQRHGEQACQEADRHRPQQVDRGQEAMGGDREHRPRAEQVRPQQRRHRGGQGHRDQAAGLPLEEQDLDGQEHRGHRRVEDRRHPARRPRHQQSFPLSGGQMEDLSDDRSDRAPRHDDRSLGPEWPARADRDGRRDRLEDRDLRAHPAPADQDRLHRLGDAVPPDPLRPVTGHQPDDQPAQHRHQHRGPAQRVVRRRARLEREMLKIEQIRK